MMLPLPWSPGKRAAIEWWWVPSRASRAIELIPIIETARGLNKATRSSLAAPASSRSLSASAIFTLDVIVSLEAGARQHAPLIENPGRPPVALVRLRFQSDGNEQGMKAC
jgi:hypothetical protein